MSEPDLFPDLPAETPFVPELASYDWIVVNSSAGKDSQAMLDYVVSEAVKAGVRDRLVVLHCDLGNSPKGNPIEWPGTKELAQEHAEHYGLRFIVVRRGVRGFLEQVDYRGKWPSNNQRYCTSKFKQDQGNKAITALADEARNAGFLEQVERLGHWPRAATRNCTSTFKRDQGQRAVTQLAQELNAVGFLEQVEHRGKWSSQGQRLCTSNNKREPANQGITHLADEVRELGTKKVPSILQCFGFRAQESPRRRKMQPFSTDKRTSNTRKLVQVWLPIQDWTVEQVWARIKQAGTRHHYAYDQGMSRLSCRFCIFAPKSQLILSGRLNPELLQEYVDVERKIGHRFRMELSLVEVQEAVQRGEEVAPDDGAWNM
jgi:3'-phosphoadenosine 5'-phosphosulfate sulfotransferase (PAPS reductase)/FAD synthetase